MALLDGDMKRSSVLVVLDHLDISLSIEQKLDASTIASLDCEYQRRVVRTTSTDATTLDIGSSIEQ